MQRFSRNTVAELKTHTLFHLALPPLQSFLEINVNKEVEKDRRVITRAASLVDQGRQVEQTHSKALLQEFREVDREFIKQAAAFLINISIPYQDIEPCRRKRIELLLGLSHDILSQWQPGTSLRRAVKQLYTEAQLFELLQEILRLYTKETRMLSNSIQLPSVLNTVRNKVLQTVTDAMEKQATALARSAAKTIYG